MHDELDDGPPVKLENENENQQSMLKQTLKNSDQVAVFTSIY